MKKIALSLLVLAFSAAAALAQSSPGLVFGQVPTAAQWNSYFAAKQDLVGPLGGILSGNLPNPGSNVSASPTWAGLTLTGLSGSGTTCVQASSAGVLSSTGTACGAGGGGAVTSVSNANGTLTISPTTGAVVASLNPAHANTWSAVQTFNSSQFALAGATSGTTVLNASATASGILTLPAATDQLIARATADTLTNKTFNTAAAGNVFQINGTTITAISGSTGTVGTTSGTLTSGHCVSINAGNLIDAGGACTTGGGGGTVSAGTQFQMAFYATSGTTVAGDGNWTDNGSVLRALLPVDVSTFSINIEVPNAASTGTTNAHLVKLTGAPSTGVSTATTDTSGAIGVVLSGGGTTGSAIVAVGGNVACAFDAGTTAGDYIKISASIAGDCSDAGAAVPSSGQVLGQVLSTNAGAGTYTILLSNKSYGQVVTVGGDLSGNLPNPTVAKINGTAIPSAPSANQALIATSSTNAVWEAVPAAALASGAAASNVGTLSGDLSGTLPSPTVAKVNGTSVPATPSANQVLTATSGTASGWALVANASLATMAADTVKCNNTGSIAAPTDCTAITLSNITGIRSGSWAAPSGNLLRFKDRFFAGDAAANYPATSNGPFLGNTCASGDWFSTFEGTTSNGTCGYIGSFQTVVETDASLTSSSGGIMGAAQSKNAGTAQGTVGVMGFGLNNSLTTTFPTWGGYFECDQNVNHQGCTGIEIDVANLISNAAAGSPDAYQQGNLPTLQLACGAGLSSPTTFQCSSAIQVVANASAFKIGINFLSTAIANTTGALGTFPVAVALAASQGIVWYSSAGTQIGGIAMTTPANLSLVTTTMQMNGVTLVNCPAGTVNGATIAIANGVVTHC